MVKAILKDQKARNWHKIAFQMSQSSVVSYPKQVFYDVVFSEVKTHLQNLKEEKSKSGLTMIMQVFDHSSCRIASKYLLKNFLSEYAPEGGPAGEQEMESKEVREKQIKDHFRAHGDRSSVFYTDDDFKDLLSEWDSQEQKDPGLPGQDQLLEIDPQAPKRR